MILQSQRTSRRQARHDRRRRYFLPLPPTRSHERCTSLPSCHRPLSAPYHRRVRMALSSLSPCPTSHLLLTSRLPGQPRRRHLRHGRRWHRQHPHYRLPSPLLSSRTQMPWAKGYSRPRRKMRRLPRHSQCLRFYRGRRRPRRPPTITAPSRLPCHGQRFLPMCSTARRLRTCHHRRPRVPMLLLMQVANSVHHLYRVRS